MGARPAAGRPSARVRPAARGPGESTARSHGGSFAVPPGWLADGRGMAPDDVRAGDPGGENAGSLCPWLSDAGGVCAATADVRPCALRPPAGHAGLAEPAYLEWASALRAVGLPRSPSGEAGWLPVEAADPVMESASPDAREHAMPVLPCDSGARVSEIANARRCDLRLDAPATTGPSGKGRKAGIVPLCDQVAGMASAYLAATAGAPDSPPFASHGGRAMGRAGITHVPRRHVAAAHGADPSSCRRRPTRTRCATRGPPTSSRRTPTSHTSGTSWAIPLPGRPRPAPRPARGQGRGLRGEPPPA